MLQHHEWISMVGKVWTCMGGKRRQCCGTDCCLIVAISSQPEHPTSVSWYNFHTAPAQSLFCPPWDTFTNWPRSNSSDSVLTMWFTTVVSKTRTELSMEHKKAENLPALRNLYQNYILNSGRRNTILDTLPFACSLVVTLLARDSKHVL